MTATGKGVARSAARRLLPLIGVVASVGVAQTATRVSAIALPWFVLVTTGSAAQTGLVVFCEMAPYVTVKALSGPVVDRMGPRLISWTTDVVSAAGCALVPLLHATGHLSYGLLLGLVAVIGASRGPGDLGKEIMTPEAAERSHVPLERATGLSGVAERLAATLGPAAGGALAALLSPLVSLAVTAVCFAAGSVIVGLALPRGMGRPVRQGQTPEAAEPGYWRRLGEGFRHLRNDRLLRAVIVTAGITNLLDTAFTSVLVPVWAKQSGAGPAVVGLVLSARGIAAVIGSVITSAVAHRLRRRLVFIVGFFLAGAPRFWILAVDVPTWVTIAVFVVCGFGSGFVNPIVQVVFFERVPRRLLGRVGALGDAFAWAGIPFGGLLGGAAVAAAGLAPVLFVAGFAHLLTAGLTGLFPEWREMDRKSGAVGTEPVDPSPPSGTVPSPREVRSESQEDAAADGRRLV